MKKLTVILMALLLVLTMMACVDNDQGDESSSGTGKPAESSSDIIGEDDPIEESTPVDNESSTPAESPDASDSDPSESAVEPSVSETETAAPETKPETTKNNSGVIELPRDTF